MLPLIRCENVIGLPADELIALFRNAPPATFGRLDVRTGRRFKNKLAPNKTNGAPIEMTYTPRKDFVSQALCWWFCTTVEFST